MTLLLRSIVILLALFTVSRATVDYDLGDVDHDGSITATDVSLILQYVVGSITSTELDLTLADLSGDGTITAYDAALLQQVVDSGVTKVSSQHVYVPLATVKYAYR